MYLKEVCDVRNEGAYIQTSICSRAHFQLVRLAAIIRDERTTSINIFIYACIRGAFWKIHIFLFTFTLLHSALFEASLTIKPLIKIKESNNPDEKYMYMHVNNNLNKMTSHTFTAGFVFLVLPVYEWGIIMGHSMQMSTLKSANWR